MRPLCIYHGSCADGFTAAWCVWKALASGPGALPEGVEFVAGVYQDPPPAVKGRDVIMVDFSYKRDAIEKMLRQARSFVILDHHKSAIEDLDGLFGTPPVDLTWEQVTKGGMKAGIFKLNRSGAGLAWDFFHAGKPAPRLVQYVEDRDLWRFQLPMSRAVNANIFSHAYAFETWEQLYWDLQDGAKLQRFAQGGDAIERKHHKDCAELAAALKRRMTIGGHEVWAANLPYTLTSDAGHLMAQGAPFAACYWDTPEGRVFSLRSTEQGLDVSEIARQYGGGGHQHAAGFRVAFSKLGALA